MGVFADAFGLRRLWNGEAITSALPEEEKGGCRLESVCVLVLVCPGIDRRRFLTR